MKQKETGKKIIYLGKMPSVGGFIKGKSGKLVDHRHFFADRIWN